MRRACRAVAWVIMMVGTARAGAPMPQAGGFAVVDVGERYGDWRVVGAPGSVAWVSGTYVHNGLSFPAFGTTAAQRRTTWVNLAAISRSATGIMHGPVATNVGQAYTLSFYLGNIVDPAGIYGSTSTVNVYENATFLGSFTNTDGEGTNTETWRPFTVTFNADAANTEIAFINADGPGDMNCGIDTVVFGAAPLSIPAGGRP